MKIRQIAFVCSGISYGIALFLPAFALAEGQSNFLLGFVCLLFGFGELAWYANPLYFASLIALLMKKTHIAALLSFAALAIALTTLRIKEVPRNEAGNMTAVVGYGPAFFLWLFSMLVILVAALMGFLKPKASNQTSQ